MNHTVMIIAEAGVNHNGDPDKAFQLVDAALASGADAVKFQTFKAEALVVRSAEKAAYQKKTTDDRESQYQMLKRLELDHSVFEELAHYCQDKGIEFLSTAFDHQSLEFLVQSLDLQTLKIPSGEITNAPLLLAHARMDRKLILSTGMATLGEIEQALSVLAFGLLGLQRPSVDAFLQAYSSIEGQQVLKEKVSILHCTTEYPAPFDEVNLDAMLSLQKAFGLKVGYSDHTQGIMVPVIATAMGASVIEKHFTLDRSLSGPDHAASLQPEELGQMVAAIRLLDLVRGDGVKRPSQSEMANREVVRKYIVAAKDIRPGEVFTEENLAIKRVDKGIQPIAYWKLLGQKSNKAYQVDQVIET